MDLDNPFELQTVVDLYTKLAESYHDYSAALEDFARLVPTGDSVLEIGVGQGHFAKRLVDFGYQVVGIDVSSRMLALCPDAVRTVESELLNFQGRFDVVVSHSGVYRVKEEKVEMYYQSVTSARASAKHISDLVKPGGLFLVNESKGFLPQVTRKTLGQSSVMRYAAEKESAEQRRLTVDLTEFSSWLGGKFREEEKSEVFYVWKKEC